MNPLPGAILVRGSVLHFLADPGPEDDASAWQYFEDGGLFIQDGVISACGDWATVLASMSKLSREAARYVDYRGKLILPGFVDSHVHYPQMRVMGSFGRQLLDWLEHYTFPAEASFADRAVAEQTAAFFLDRLLAHGATTASVFATVHAHSADAFFKAADARNLRMLCGKVLMDRHCPENLRDDPQRAWDDSRALIERWHGKGRQRYSVTPRFAPTSTEAQLEVAGKLFASAPELHLQSHLSENPREIEWVRELFPGRQNYLDVYAHYGLIGPRSIYGHGIHLDAGERARLAETGTAIAFCPASNLFLGSGFFDFEALSAAGVPVGLASDVGGGNSLSPLRSMAAAYMVSQAQHQPLSPWRAWYMSTLGGAQALGLDSFIGNFAPGKEADFVVLDAAPIPELAFRTSFAESLADRLFALMMLGDERCVAATHVMGECAFKATPNATTGL